MYKILSVTEKKPLRLATLYYKIRYIDIRTKDKIRHKCLLIAARFTLNIIMIPQYKALVNEDLQQFNAQVLLFVLREGRVDASICMKALGVCVSPPSYQSLVTIHCFC